MEIKDIYKYTKREKKQAYEKAEQIERKLKKALEDTIYLCESNKGPYTFWSEKFFKPALKALSIKGTPIHRLSRACINLPVFGGMGSWSDVGGGIDRSDSLFLAYQEANNFYEECWMKGIS